MAKRKYNMENRLKRKAVPLNEFQLEQECKQREQEKQRTKRHYDMSKRKSRAFFKSVADTAKLIDKLESDISYKEKPDILDVALTRTEKYELRKLNRKKHRNKPGYGEIQRERRIRRRQRRLPVDRRCPKCSKIVLNSRQWVIIDKESNLPLSQVESDARILLEDTEKIIAICISCYRKQKREQEILNLFTPVVK